MAESHTATAPMTYAMEPQAGTIFLRAYDPRTDAIRPAAHSQPQWQTEMIRSPRQLPAFEAAVTACLVAHGDDTFSGHYRHPRFANDYVKGGKGWYQVHERYEPEHHRLIVRLVKVD